MTSKMRMSMQEALKVTHFVRIPLVTRTSLPQILESYRRLENDPIFALVPKSALTHPANLHFTLGSLSLPTPSHVEAALKLLESITVRQEDQPLTAHVVGIGNSLASRSPRNLSRDLRLFSRIEDPTNSLQGFCHEVYLGLRDEFKREFSQTYPIPFQTRVIHTIRSIPEPATGKQRKGLRTRIDATDILRKCKDVILMKNVKLQELHISEIGLKKVLYEDVAVAGYRNVATVSLPGTAGDGTKPLQTELDASIPVRTPK